MWRSSAKEVHILDRDAKNPDRLSIRTTDVDASQQIEYWIEGFSAVWGRVDVIPAGSLSFYGAMQSVRISSLWVNRCKWQGMRFKRPRGQPFYSVSFPQRGRSMLLMGSNALDLSVGAAYFIDNSFDQMEWQSPSIYETFNIRISDEQLRARLGGRFDGRSRALDQRSVVLDLLKVALQRLSSQLPDSTDPRSIDFLDRQLSDLVAFCLSSPISSCSEEGAVLLAHRERTDRCIDRHFADPDLDPNRLATLCGISESYLHKIYRGTKLTVMERVREVRLQTATNLLRSQPRITVSEVAYKVGFKSLAEFSRAYKRRFGLSPQFARKLS